VIFVGSHRTVVPSRFRTQRPAGNIAAGAARTTLRSEAKEKFIMPADVIKEDASRP
jgi:hypothetical protein